LHHSFKTAKAIQQLSPQNTIILQDQRPIFAEVDTHNMNLTITQLHLAIAVKNNKQNKTWTKKTNAITK
jgi:dTDP-4-amino-4,6-dideoxygalactose transaminase